MLPPRLAKQIEGRLVDVMVDLKGWTISVEQYVKLSELLDEIRIQLRSAVEKKDANV